MLGGSCYRNALASTLAAAALSLASSPAIAEGSDRDAGQAGETSTQQYSLFPADRSLTHAEDGVVLPDGRLLVGDWDHGLVTLSPDGSKQPFGDFAAAGFRSRPDALWNSPNGISWEPDMRHVLVADITGGHIYRVDTMTEQVRLIYDHPFGVNAVVRDPSGAIWFTQSTENEAGEGSESRMFAAADRPLSDGAVWRIAADQLDRDEPRAVKMVEGLDFANGIAFDAARGRLYVAEIVRSRVLGFSVDPDSGALGDRRVLVELPTPDNLELDDNGDLWIASPFGNAVFVVDPDTGTARTVFAPTPQASADIVAETNRRLANGESVLELLTPQMWGPMPGLLTGVILAPDGTVYVSGLGNALVRLEQGTPAGYATGGFQAEIEQVLRHRTHAVLEAIRTGEIAQVLELYTDDAVYSPSSDSLLTDAAGIAAFWQAVVESPASTATLEVVRIEWLGPDAFHELQRYEVFDGEGERMFGGYASLIWRKVGERWLIAADVSN
ncbi:SMP-30/gluconolactonase/LRE family protein [Erythrobacter alti]|uniref:SMP-30/gluconolactonase/LRE family protein n=1 Tax=Erythrobacter alti TaxID=1896145 RepID=UPI0030F42DC4